MKKKLALSLAVVALLSALTTNAYANDQLISSNPQSTAAQEETVEAAEETTDGAEAVTKKLAVVTVDGKELVPVTSSVCDLLPNVNLTCLYDFDEESELSVAFDEETPSKKLSIYTALEAPVVVDTFAVKIDGEKGDVIGINVYATNDTMLEDWYRLKVENPAEDKDGFKVFSVKEFVRKFRYYKFEFVVLTGNGFSLSELALYCDEGENVHVEYKTDGEVEEGSEPEKIVAEEKTEEAIPLFDTFGIRFAN